MRPPFERYGLRFTEGQDDLWVELHCIKNGGRWTVDGKECGAGMFTHLMNARKLIWPNRYCHRWTELMYREFIKNDVTVLMGCASSQKTSHAVEFCLLNYWARPENTLVVLSSTTLDKLDIGAHAELMMLWKEGQKRFDWLPGHALPHKRAITTDKLEEQGMRDFRKGIICRPCVPSGTLIDTPSGRIPIEKIRVGDVVINASGAGRVLATSQTRAPALVRILLNDRRTLECTPEHPVLTQSGWKQAVDIIRSDRVYSVRETLQILREANAQLPPESEVLFSGMPDSGPSFEEMQAVRSAFSPQELRASRETEQFLLSLLLGEMVHEPAASEVACFCGQGLGSGGQENSRMVGSQSFGKKATCGNASLKGWCGCVGDPAAILENEEADRAVCFQKKGPGERYYSNGNRYAETVSCCAIQLQDVADLVQSRFGIPEGETRRGVGRRLSLSSETNNSRPKARPNLTGAWVDSVEILERSCDPRYKESEGGYRVHNLEVEGHPSYSANGVIVHNCFVGGRWVGLGTLAGVKQDYLFFVADELQFMEAAFSGSWPHLFSNGQVKVIGSGNPKHDPDDELGKTAEPKDGWGAHPEPQKTEVWDTKFMGARCINLIGTDSPNFDTPPGKPEPFKRLIGRKFEQRIAHDYGKDSFEYYRLVKGAMKVSFAHSRVITRQLCRDHGASDRAEWEDNQQKRLYWLDPSYGGEDACAGGCLEWGKGLNGLTLIRLVGYRLYHFNLTSPREIEDQIADILAEELNVYGVGSDDAFYDSTGKGTLGGAFARKFGVKAPRPVDSGAQPTHRPVRQDLFIEEPDGKKRLKMCFEHYSKFVSEMWFSVRYCIEAGQMRELPDEFITEGCARLYSVVAGNRIEVESKSDPKKKEDLKRRLGHSPNLFDGLCFSGSTKLLTPTGEVEIRNAFPGTEVVTPFGVTKVAICHEALTDELCQVEFTNHRVLEGTPDHKVFTKDKGWVALDRLSFTNECESSSTIPLWRLLNELFSKVKATTFSTQVDTIIGARKGLRRRDFYIESFGCSTSVLFLKVIASIIRTAIGEIIKSRTLSWFRQMFTPETTCENVGEVPCTESASWKHFLSVCEPLPDGMGPGRATNGTPSKASQVGSTENVMRRSASNAEKSSRASSQAARSSARSPAPTSSTGRSIKMLFVTARYAARSLWQTVTKQHAIAPEVVRRLLLPESKRVYNLTLEEHNVFYANGILVKNCIGIEGARQRGFQIASLSAAAESADDEDFFETEAKQFREIIESKLLSHP